MKAADLPLSSNDVNMGGRAVERWVRVYIVYVHDAVAPVLELHYTLLGIQFAQLNTTRVCCFSRMLAVLLVQPRCS